LKSDENIGYYI